MKYRSVYTPLISTIAVLALSGCGVPEADAKRAIEAHGITNVEIGGYAFWGCSEDDKLRSKWTGIGSNGQPISGVICGGLLFKGYTVRFN